MSRGSPNFLPDKLLSHRGRHFHAFWRFCVDARGVRSTSNESADSLVGHPSRMGYRTPAHHIIIIQSRVPTIWGPLNNIAGNRRKTGTEGNLPAFQRRRVPRRLIARFHKRGSILTLTSAATSCVATHDVTEISQSKHPRCRGTINRWRHRTLGFKQT